jgi:hypothetical protein
MFAITHSFRGAGETRSGRQFMVEMHLVLLLLLISKYSESHSLKNNDLQAPAWANLTVDEKESITP